MPDAEGKTVVSCRAGPNIRVVIDILVVGVSPSTGDALACWFAGWAGRGACQRGSGATDLHVQTRGYQHP